MNAMIFAAGLGTRLRPYTNDRPKAMVEVDGRPMIAHQMVKLKKAGFRRVVINVHHFAQQIIDYVNANDGFGLDVAFSDETGLLLDTGGGIRKALPLFDNDKPILIHNVDIFSNADLATLYSNHMVEGADASLLVSRRSTSRFLVFDDSLEVDLSKTNKASMCFTLPHAPGSLAHVLTILSFYDMNLTRIQSLPIPGQEWQYFFYVDIKFQDYLRYEQALAAVRPLMEDLNILGEYVASI